MKGEDALRPGDLVEAFNGHAWDLSVFILSGSFEGVAFFVVELRNGAKKERRVVYSVRRREKG